MTYEEVCQVWDYVPFTIDHLVAILPEYVKYGRVMAADWCGFAPKDIRQQSIVRYLLRVHEYDAVEISWIAERSKRK